MSIVLHLTLYDCPKKAQISQNYKYFQWFIRTRDFTITCFISQRMTIPPLSISNIMQISCDLVELKPFEVCDPNGQNVIIFYSRTLALCMNNFACSVLVSPNRCKYSLHHLHTFFQMHLMTHYTHLVLCSSPI